MDPNRFLTRTLRAHPQNQEVCRIMAAAIDAVEPAAAVARHLRLDGQHY